DIAEIEVEWITEAEDELAEKLVDQLFEARKRAGGDTSAEHDIRSWVHQNETTYKHMQATGPYADRKVVPAVLDRVAAPPRGKTVLVADMTASMAPYYWSTRNWACQAHARGSSLHLLLYNDSKTTYACPR